MANGNDNGKTQDMLELIQRDNEAVLQRMRSKSNGNGNKVCEVHDSIVEGIERMMFMQFLTLKRSTRNREDFDNKNTRVTVETPNVRDAGRLTGMAALLYLIAKYHGWI